MSVKAAISGGPCEQKQRRQRTVDRLPDEDFERGVIFGSPVIRSTLKSPLLYRIEVKSPHTVGPFGLVLILLLGCNSRTPEIPPSSSQPFMRLSEGEYLSNVYIDALKSTRSAYKAGKTGQINNVILHRKGTTVSLEPIVNFHEGGTEFAIRRDGSVSSVEAATEYIRNPTVHVLDDHTFMFGFGEFQPATYVFVNDAIDYVSRAVLVGKYKDKQGRAYEFRGDGWAVFPDRKFKFEIGVDHVLNDYDYFMEDKKKTWAFKRSGGRLQIFPTTDVEGFDQISSDRPFLSLREVR
jgi:hypothetical protein